MTAPPSSPALDALLSNVGWVHALARQLCADVHTAADAAQAACVAATRRPPRDVSKVRSYLARLLRNVLQMERRGASRRVRREQAVATSTAAATPSAHELVERAELQQGLVAAVLALPAPQRELVLRHYFDGESVAEIARLLGRSPDAVQAQLRRARERLRLDLDRRGMLHAVLALPAPFASAMVWPTAFITGGILMQGKLALAGAAVVAALGLWWLSSGAPDIGTVPAPSVPSPAPVAAQGETSTLPSHRGSTAAASAGPAPALVREAVALPLQVRGRLVGLHPRLRWTTPLALHTTWRNGATGGSREDDAEVDADGAFHFVLPAEARSASLRIVVKAADAAYVPVVQSLDVAAAQADELQIAVVPAPVVLGQVVDEAGAAVAGASVLLFAAADGVPKPGEQARQETGADGTFRLALGEPMQHLVVALPPNGRADLVAAGTLVTRTTPVAELAPLVTATAVHVTGRVRWSNGAPVARAEVEWRARTAVELDKATGLGWNADGTLTWRSCAVTDEAGRFLLPARHGETASVLVSRVDGCLPAEFNMKRATAPQDVEISVAGRPVTIEVLADGQPAGTAGVQWRRESPVRVAGNFGTDERGVLRQIVLDEPLRLRAVSTDGTRSSEWHAFPKGPPEHVVLELLPADGVPVSVAIDDVELQQANFLWRPSGGGSARSIRATAVDGRFALRLPPGQYRVSLQQVAATASQYLLPAEHEVTVPAGGGDLRFRAELGGNFRLSVTDAGGAFVAGRYRVLRGGVPYGPAQRTRDGEVHAMLLPARPHTSDVLPGGEYEVVVDLEARGEYRAAVKVAPSETAEVRIRVP